MKTLIIAATYFEAKHIIENLSFTKKNDTLFSNNEYNCDILISGVGIPACLFALLSFNNIKEYEFFINIGIAGSFKQDLEIGKVFNVVSDSFEDVFIRQNGEKINVFKSNFNQHFYNLINNGRLYNTSDYPNFFHNLTKISGKSVNMPELNTSSNYDIETMEGAAFMLVCKHLKKNFIQLRGISNIIPQTKREDWDMKTPIDNYTKLVLDFLKLNK